MYEELKSKILLETGTNELEIVEFKVGQEWYCINVAKVREIIRAEDGLAKPPNSHFAIEGMINLRDSVIPVINLERFFNFESDLEKKDKRIIIADFNNMQIGFLVSFVSKIHRISWEAVRKPSELIQGQAGYSVAVIKLEEKILLLLDFEKITGEINPEGFSMNFDENDYNNLDDNIDRASKTILVVEDSDFVAEIMVKYLKTAGYSVKVLNNGLEAWELLENIKKDNDKKIESTFNLLISDIEMPKMDGFHFVKKLKEDQVLNKLPCLIVSSMITDELILKCKKVGADDQLSKSELNKLVKMVDKYVL